MTNDQRGEGGKKSDKKYVRDDQSTTNIFNPRAFYPKTSFFTPKYQFLKTQKIWHEEFGIKPSKWVILKRYLSM
jgi:hypothetical protein